MSNRNEKASNNYEQSCLFILSILDLSKTVMCDFCYGYIKPKYGENAKLCYMNTDSFITHVKADDIYKNIAEDVGTRFDTSNYEID